MNTGNRKWRQAAVRCATVCVALAVLLAALPAAWAQSKKKDDDRLDKAWDAVAALNEGLLSDPLEAMLNNMAYQAAVTNVCPGFELDVKAFSKAFTDIQQQAADEQEADFSDDDIRAWNTAMAVKLGVATGLFIAEGKAKPKDFCANAAELKRDKDVPNYWE